MMRMNEKGGGSKPHLVINGSIPSCCRNPNLLEEFVTYRILKVLTWIRKIAKDKPEIQEPSNE